MHNNIFKYIIYVIIYIFISGCVSHEFTTDEARDIVKPIINSILDYKKSKNRFPTKLTDIDISNEKFKIDKTAQSNMYIYTDKYNYWIIYINKKPNMLSNQNYRHSFELTFGNKYDISSVFVGFKDKTYSIFYFDNGKNLIKNEIYTYDDVVIDKNEVNDIDIEKLEKEFDKEIEKIYR